MICDVYDGVPVIEGDNGQRIGIGTNCPSMRLYVGAGGVSLAAPENSGVSGNGSG